VHNTPLFGPLGSGLDDVCHFSSAGVERSSRPSGRFLRWFLLALLTLHESALNRVLLRRLLLALLALHGRPG
jgi:hypothetical protein